MKQSASSRWIMAVANALRVSSSRLASVSVRRIGVLMSDWQANFMALVNVKRARPIRLVSVHWIVPLNRMLPQWRMLVHRPLLRRRLNGRRQNVHWIVLPRHMLPIQRHSIKGLRQRRHSTVLSSRLVKRRRMKRRCDSRNRRRKQMPQQRFRRVLLRLLLISWASKMPMVTRRQKVQRYGMRCQRQQRLKCTRTRWLPRTHRVPVGSRVLTQI